MANPHSDGTPVEDGHVSLGALALAAVDVAYESLFDTQRALALLPSSYESGDALLAGDEAAAVERAKVEDAATQRRAGVLDWVNRTISLFAQLHAVSHTHVPSHASDGASMSTASALERCKVILADARAVRTGLEDTSAAVHSIADIMRAGARPRFDISSAVGIRVQGAPFALLPGDAYTAPPPLYGNVDRNARVHTQTHDLMLNEALAGTARACSDAQLLAMLALCEWPPHMQRHVCVHAAADTNDTHVLCPGGPGIHVFVWRAAVHVCVHHRLVLQLHALNALTQDTPEPWRVASLTLASHSRTVAHTTAADSTDGYTSTCAGTPTAVQLTRLASALQTQLYTAARVHARAALSECVGTCVAVANAYLLSHTFAHARAHITAPDTTQIIQMPTTSIIPGATSVTRLEITRSNACSGGRVRVCTDGVTLLLSTLHVKHLAAPLHARVRVHPFRITHTGVDASGRSCARAHVVVCEHAHASARGMYEPFADVVEAFVGAGISAQAAHSAHTNARTILLMPDDGGIMQTLAADDGRLWERVYGSQQAQSSLLAVQSATSVYERSASTGVFERAQASAAITAPLRELIDMVSSRHLNVARAEDCTAISALLQLKTMAARVHSVTSTATHTFEWSATPAPRVLGPDGSEIEFKLSEAAAPAAHACIAEAAPAPTELIPDIVSFHASMRALSVSDVTGTLFIRALRTIWPRASPLAYARVIMDNSTSLLMLLNSGSALYVSQCLDAAQGLSPMLVRARLCALVATHARAMASLNGNRDVILAHVLSAAASGRGACLAAAPHTNGVLLGRGGGAAGEVGGVCLSITEDAAARRTAQHACAASVAALLRVAQEAAGPNDAALKSDAADSFVNNARTRVRLLVLEHMHRMECDSATLAAGVRVAYLPRLRGDAAAHVWEPVPGTDTNSDVVVTVQRSMRLCAHLCATLACAIMKARASLCALTASGDAGSMSCTVHEDTGRLSVEFSPQSFIHASMDAADSGPSFTLDDARIQSSQEPATTRLRNLLEDMCDSANERLRRRVRAVVNICSRMIADACDAQAGNAASVFSHSMRALAPTWFPLPRGGRDDASSVASSAARSDAACSDMDDEARAHVAALLQPLCLEACMHTASVSAHSAGTLAPIHTAPRVSYRSGEVLSACITELDKNEALPLLGGTRAQRAQSAFEAHQQATSDGRAENAVHSSVPHAIATMCVMLADTHACEAVALLSSAPIDTPANLDRMMSTRAALLASEMQPSAMLSIVLSALGYDTLDVRVEVRQRLRAWLASLHALLDLPRAQHLFDAATVYLPQDSKETVHVSCPSSDAGVRSWATVAATSLKCACAVASVLAHESARLASHLRTTMRVHVFMCSRALLRGGHLLRALTPSGAHLLAPFTQYMRSSVLTDDATPSLLRAGVKRRLEESTAALRPLLQSCAPSDPNARPLFTGSGVIQFVASVCSTAPAFMRNDALQVFVSEDAVDHATSDQVHTQLVVHVCAGMRLPAMPRLSISAAAGVRAHDGADVQWIVAPAGAAEAVQQPRMRLRWMHHSSVMSFVESFGMAERSVLNLPPHYSPDAHTGPTSPTCAVVELPYEWVAPINCDVAASWLQRKLLSPGDKAVAEKRARPSSETPAEPVIFVCDSSCDRICAAVRVRIINALVAAMVHDGARACLILEPLHGSNAWLPAVGVPAHAPSCMMSSAETRTASRILSMPWTSTATVVDAPAPAAVSVMFAHAGVGAAVRAALGSQLHSTAAARLRMRAVVDAAVSAPIAVDAQIDLNTAHAVQPTTVVLASVLAHTGDLHAASLASAESHVKDVTDTVRAAVDQLLAASGGSSACSADVHV